METSIKILHIQKLVAKNGTRYQLVHCLVTIGKSEFVRRFAIFDLVE